MDFDIKDRKAFDFAADATKQILTLSTGILALTITFAKDILGAPGHWSRLLGWSWILYLISILCGVWTLLALTGSFSSSGQRTPPTSPPPTDAPTTPTQSKGSQSPGDSAESGHPEDPKPPGSPSPDPPQKGRGIWGSNVRIPSLLQLATFCYATALLVWFAWSVPRIVPAGNTAPKTGSGDPVSMLSAALSDVADGLRKVSEHLEIGASGELALAPVFWMTVAILVIGGGGGLALAGFSKTVPMRVFGATIGTLSLLGGGISLFKVSEVNVRPQFSGHIAAAASSLDCVDQVGPFTSGEFNALETPSRTPANIVKTLEAQSKNRELVQLVLIGSADKFELSSSLRATYGSNTGLARVRADWVQQELSKEMRTSRLGSPKYLTLTVGPIKHGRALTRDEASSDRSVAACPVWGRRSGFLGWLLSLGDMTTDGKPA